MRILINQKQVAEREKLHLQQKREREIAQVNTRYQQMMVTPQQMVNNNHPIYNNNNQLVLIHPRVNIEEIDD